MVGHHLRSGYSVYGLQPGGDAIDCIEDLARYAGNSIEAVQPAGSYLLIGASLGGLIIMLEVA